VIYVVQQEINKENIAQQMARQLPEANLVKIKNSQEIKWEEAGKEFYYGGTFYDVVKTEKINGVTWYFCINDKMESLLYNNYTTSFKNTTEALPVNKQSKQVLKFSLSYFILYTNEISTLSTYNKNHFNLIDQALKSMVLNVNAPPPRLV